MALGLAPPYRSVLLLIKARAVEEEVKRIMGVVYAGKL
jgi:hypothetical protein